jgi:hypothetical protein
MSRPVTNLLSTALAATLIVLAAPAPGAHAAPVDDVSVTVVTANGSGCPGTDATAHVLPDGTSFTIDFSGFYASAGGGAPVTAFRRNCQFAIQVSQPDGRTYAVEKAEYSGYALLRSGMTGLQATRYYFQGRSETTVASREIAGPFSGTWATTETFAPDEQQFAPCDSTRNLNVNSELRLRRPLPASVPTNLMVMNPSLTLHLTWRAC